MKRVPIIQWRILVLPHRHGGDEVRLVREARRRGVVALGRQPRVLRDVRDHRDDGRGRLGGAGAAGGLV